MLREYIEEDGQDSIQLHSNGSLELLDHLGIE